MSKNIVKIGDGDYCIVKAKNIPKDYFCCVKDNNETTLIVNEKNIDKNNTIKVEKGFKLLTFRINLPFSLVGFIAKISSALAQESIPIFVISSFSTDHILIKKKFLKKTIRKLNSIGFETK